MEQTTQTKIIREFNMYGEINEKLSLSFREFVSQIINQDQSNFQSNPLYKPETVRINLNTPGGSTTEGSAIISTIRELQSCGIQVHIHCEGEVCSMGIPISVAADIRTGDNLTEFMIHGSSMGTFSYVSKSKRILEFQSKMDKKLDDFIISRSNITQDLLEKYKEDEYFFTYDEALELGILTDDLFLEEVDPSEKTLNIIRGMSKAEIINHLNSIKDPITTKLETENKKKTKDKILINVLEGELNTIESIFEILSETPSINELNEIYAMLIYDTINPLLEEDDSNEE